MKLIKHLALAAFLTLSVFLAVSYSSCSKDSCGDVTCMKGKCNGGLCACDTGVGGANCEIIYRNLYAHTYKGNPPGNSIHTDSVNTLVFTPDITDTTNFSTMHVQWNDTGTQVVLLPITLANYSSTGSTFTVTPTPVVILTGPVVYTGSGSVNGTTASMELQETHPNGSVSILHFYNFARQ